MSNYIHVMNSKDVINHHCPDPNAEFQIGKTFSKHKHASVGPQNLILQNTVMLRCSFLMSRQWNSPPKGMGIIDTYVCDVRLPLSLITRGQHKMAAPLQTTVPNTFYVHDGFIEIFRNWFISLMIAY